MTKSQIFSPLREENSDFSPGFYENFGSGCLEKWENGQKKKGRKCGKSGRNWEKIRGKLGKNWEKKWEFGFPKDCPNPGPKFLGFSQSMGGEYLGLAVPGNSRGDPDGNLGMGQDQIPKKKPKIPGKASKT